MYLWNESSINHLPFVPLSQMAHYLKYKAYSFWDDSGFLTRYKYDVVQGDLAF